MALKLLLRIHQNVDILGCIAGGKIESVECFVTLISLQFWKDQARRFVYCSFKGLKIEIDHIVEFHCFPSPIAPKSPSPAQRQNCFRTRLPFVSCTGRSINARHPLLPIPPKTICHNLNALSKRTWIAWARSNSAL